jgi:hypothetical protein
MLASIRGRFRHFKSCVRAEFSAFWKGYTSFVTDVDHTTGLPRVMDYVQAQVLFYYTQARWVVFIVVLAYWTTITVDGTRKEGVGRTTAASKAH